ncbi:MAG: sulfotransferase [bacterium]|nr:sulfotransferase [bacterium]
MYTYLKQHPEIFVSVLKEPHFFGSDLSRQPHTVRDQEVYLNLFADAGPQQKAGEGSVWYLRSRRAAAEIKAFCPDAGILIMLRNPVEMIHSLHALYLRTGNEEIEDVEAAVAAQSDRLEGRRIPATTYFPEGLLYTENAMFFDKVRRFLELFGGARVRIILFDDFTADTPKSYKETLEFLGVDPGFEPNYDTRAANVAMRMEVLAQLRKLPPELRRVMRGSGRRHLGPRPAMRPELRRRLQRHLAADVEQLSALIGRDLRHWGADEQRCEEPR